MRKAIEPEYYPKLKKALENHFTNLGYLVDFEVIGRKKTPLRRFFAKNSKLLKDIRALPAPDIIGSIWKKPQQNRKLVIAEFKQSPKFMDIFQTKGYDELYNSDYTLLLSAKSISESSRSTIDFIKHNICLLKTKTGKSNIYIYFLHETREGTLTLARLGTETGLPDIDAKLLEDEQPHTI